MNLEISPAAQCVDHETIMAKLAELNDWLERNKIVFIVAPEQVDRIESALRALPFEYAAGRIEVKPLPGMPVDQALVVGPQSPLLDPERPAMTFAPEPRAPNMFDEFLNNALDDLERRRAVRAFVRVTGV